MNGIKRNLKIIKVAIQARLDFKKNLTEEQKRRLSICKTCPLNSNNAIKLTYKDEIMLILNKILNFILNVSVDEDAICTECGCQLIHKTTQTEKELKCPRELW